MKGIAKWRISSSARAILTSFVSSTRASFGPTPEDDRPIEDDRRLAGVVERVLRLSAGESITEDDLRVLSSLAARFGAPLSVALAELVGCVSSPGLPSSTSASGDNPGDAECPRCGLTFGALQLPCSACGFSLFEEPERVPAVRAARDTERSRLRRLVAPLLYLASLSSARAQILDRAGSASECAGDGHRLDAIDAQIEAALHGEQGELFRETILVASGVAELGQVWPKSTGDEP